MRLLLILWFVPLALFWGWYALSANDWNMGMLFFSREIHDKVFEIYGRTLGVDPALIPGMAAAACAFDSAIVLAIAAFRWRSSWGPQTRERVEVLYARFRRSLDGKRRGELRGEGFSAAGPVSGPAPPAE